MTTATISWPTGESFALLDKSLATAFDEIEEIVLRLRSATTTEDTPDPPPTFETVGILYDAWDALGMDLDLLGDKHRELGQLVTEVNAVRRETPIERGWHDG